MEFPTLYIHLLHLYTDGGRCMRDGTARSGLLRLAPRWVKGGDNALSFVLTGRVPEATAEKRTLHFPSSICRENKRGISAERDSPFLSRQLIKRAGPGSITFARSAFSTLTPLSAMTATSIIGNVVQLVKACRVRGTVAGQWAVLTEFSSDWWM